jgi:ATP-dependent DNA helicase RecG
VDLLERLGGWRRDRVEAREGLTLAGILMFGKDLPIRDPEAVPSFFVDYRERLDPATRWSDRIYPDGTWEPNLLQFYTRVWPKLAAGIPSPFRLEGEQRRDVTPTHEALREAFVNALIHADYSGDGGIVIERCPDRYELSNPGTLLVSLEQYQRGGVSECRNPALQRMFLLIGGGERAGSGADKIRAGWRAQHWRTPRLEVTDQPDRVILTLPMVSLIPDDALNALQARIGDAIDGLTPAEVQALATAWLEGAVSNARLQQLLADHTVEITRMLARLCERGYLVSDKRRRWTTYRLPDDAPPEPWLFGGVDSPPHAPPDSPHLAGDSPHLAGGSPRSPEETHRLRETAKPVAQQGKTPARVVRQTIRELCSGRFLTAKELATLLHRESRSLQHRHLRPMVRDGLLRLRFPEATNRPDQAYTTVEGRQ